MKDNKKHQKGKQSLEFRYYEMPSDDTYVMALLGERWILSYGEEAMHFHNHLEIGYCYYGEGRMMFGEEECAYSGEVFTVIPKNSPHCTRSRTGEVCRWEYLFIDVEGFLQKIYKDRPVLAKNLQKWVEERTFMGTALQYPKMMELIRSILGEMRAKGKFYKESVRGYLLALLIEISRGVDEAEESGGAEKEEGRISKVLDYIAGHFAEEIRVSYLADMCYVSETHFRRVFEKITNMTPVEYINMVRVQNACAMLAETSDSVGEIREKTGFPTASTFNRNFKKLVKMSPGHWRQEKKSQTAGYKISIYKGW